MSDRWNFRGESIALTRPGMVMLVEGSSFCISDGSGDVSHSPHGLFFIDTRLVSSFTIRVNDQAPEPLVVHSPRPFHATFVGRTHPIPYVADSRVLIFRDRFVGRGMREDIQIRNLTDQSIGCSVEIDMGCDFAPLFAVKEGTTDEGGAHTTEIGDQHVVCTHRRGEVERGVTVTFSQPVVEIRQKESDLIVAWFRTTLEPRETWHLCVEFMPSLNGDDVEPAHRCGQPVEDSVPAQRLEDWRRDTPVVRTDHHPFSNAVSQSLEDLGALRIFDPDHPERALVAAGAPWFMTLFGRDALLTAWMALTVSPEIALGVLQTLARFQGREVDPESEEEPGRILHELRFEDAASLSLADSNVYYGSADATPLFVMLLGELRRWGLAKETVDELMPNVDAALAWIERFGDRDGDGYVEYQRTTPRGLENQGWKDSWDGVRFADGTLPEPPIAMVEIQGYVYSAYLARHFFALEAGDAKAAEYWRRRARDLKAQFNEDFWLPDRGWYAMGLDRDKRPIDALASNMGHCLWTGIIDEDKAPRVVELLMGSDLFSGWGIRTLAASMVGYNPVSYHCGSVWPHDNAIIAAGLMRYGFVEEAQRLVMALVDAADTQGGRLPELFSGLDRDEFPWVVSYPASCIPQAWSAATPFSLLRTLLRLDPWVPHGKMWLSPALPETIPTLTVCDVPLAGSRLTIDAEQHGFEVYGLPSAITLIEEPRDPMHSVR